MAYTLCLWYTVGLIILYAMQKVIDFSLSKETNNLAVKNKSVIYLVGKKFGR